MTTETTNLPNSLFAKVTQHYEHKLYEVTVLAKSLEWNLDIPIQATMKVRLMNISFSQRALVGKCVKIVFSQGYLDYSEEDFIGARVDDFVFFEPDLMVSFYQ